jgi:hypothetical protein
MIGIYPHYSVVPWDHSRWPNFHPAERNLHCPCCGEFYFDPNAFDALQRFRRKVGRPIHINSGHRCVLHNARVGGAPRSMHKLIAFDVAIRGHRLADLISAARKVGFQGFGFYQTFLHLDLGCKRSWATKGGEKVWNGLLTF